MCGFKPGDEVVCIRTQPIFGHTRQGVTYTVVGLVGPEWPMAAGGLMLAGVENGVPFGRPAFYGHNPDRFRKVERKTDKLSLTEWLSQPAGDTDRIDRSAPIAPRKRERA